jgi:hypothetical protein
VQPHYTPQPTRKHHHHRDCTPSGAETLPRNFKLKRSSSLSSSTSQYKLGGRELSKFMQIIMDEIIEESPDCSFSMVAGQQSAKQALQVKGKDDN